MGSNPRLYKTGQKLPGGKSVQTGKKAEGAYSKTQKGQKHATSRVSRRTQKGQNR